MVRKWYNNGTLREGAMQMTLNQMFRVKLECGLSCEKIAEGSGVPVSTVRKIFGNVTKHPRRKNLEMLSDYFESLYCPEVVEYFRKEAVQENWQDYGTREPRVLKVYDSASAGAATKYDFKVKTIEDYEKMPEYPRVELIDGEVFTLEAPSLAHQECAFEIAYQIKDFIRKNKGKCQCFVSPVDVHIDPEDDETMVQPDVVVICDRDKTKTGKRVEGAPDLVVEVLSPSTRNKDMNIKLNKFRECGVREYWMVDLEGQVVIIYDFSRDNVINIVSMKESIPVGICDGKLRIDFTGTELMEMLAEEQKQL